MSDWDRFNNLLAIAPVFHVELIWILVAIVATASAITWFATMSVMAFRTKAIARREYPENVVQLIGELERENAELSTNNKWLTKRADRAESKLAAIRAILNEDR